MKRAVRPFAVVLGVMLCLMLGTQSAYAQIQRGLLPDSLQVDTTQLRTPKDTVTVTPMRFPQTLTYQTVSTDSLARWQLWVNWIDRKNREPAAITYRLGAEGRTDAVILNAHDPKHQQFYWEELLLNDPVSNSINWNLMPQYKIDRIEERSNGIVHTTRFNTLRYYVNKPLTMLNYTESDFSFRSLEFMLTQNLGRKTNFEISYWDRRDGGEYPRDDLQGLQLYTQLYHHLSDNLYLKGGFVWNRMELEHPFGYQIPELTLFNFNNLNAAANRTGASADLSAMNSMLTLYHRPDTTQPFDFSATLFANKRERRFRYQPDTTNYNMGSVGGALRKRFQWPGRRVEAALRTEFFGDRNEQDPNVLTRSNWLLSGGEVCAVQNLPGRIELEGRGRGSWRSDGFSSYDLSGAIRFRPFSWLQLSTDASLGQFMPTMQELYWQSRAYRGNPDLTPESILRLGGEVKVTAGATEAGLRAERKAISDGIHLTTDSTFANMADYSVLAGTLFGRFDNRFMELNGSVTYHRYQADRLTPFTGRLLRGSDRMMLKGSAYWKGYAFNRATFIKAGVFGILSPTNYLSAEYNPLLDRWQNANQTQLVPAFYRVDLDVSARIRWFMVLLRFENLLDNVGQAGYFETAGYPMSNRRFIFGIRVRFRN